MSSSPVESEIKIAVPGSDAARELLVRSGFGEVRRRVFEVNTVFDTPEKALRLSGRLLRVRSAGDTATLTFKGQAVPGRHKVREEIETSLSDPDAAAVILDRIGYQPSFRYEKYRTELARSGDDGIVTLDETPIGCFLELEGSPDWIDATAHELGFSEAEYITGSYATLYFKYCAANGLEPGNMVFNSPDPVHPVHPGHTPE